MCIYIVMHVVVSTLYRDIYMDTPDVLGIETETHTMNINVNARMQKSISCVKNCSSLQLTWQAGNVQASLRVATLISYLVTVFIRVLAFFSSFASRFLFFINIHLMCTHRLVWNCCAAFIHIKFSLRKD